MTTQQSRLLVALLEGPITTIDSPKRAGILALSQRAGELWRMGLVIRRHVKVSESSAPVVEAALTEVGRVVAEKLRAGTITGVGCGESHTSPAARERRADTASAPPIDSEFLFAPGPVPRWKG